MWTTADLGPFDPQNDDSAKIASGIAVPCRACEAIFRRLRVTLRYCADCRKGYCEGEHLTFARGGRAVCIWEGPHP